MFGLICIHFQFFVEPTAKNWFGLQIYTLFSFSVSKKSGFEYKKWTTFDCFISSKNEYNDIFVINPKLWPTHSTLIIYFLSPTSFSLFGPKTISPWQQFLSSFILSVSKVRPFILSLLVKLYRLSSTMVWVFFFGH